MFFLFTTTVKHQESDVNPFRMKKKSFQIQRKEFTTKTL